MRTIRSLALLVVVLFAAACGEEPLSEPTAVNRREAPAGSSLLVKAAWPQAVDAETKVTIAENPLVKNYYFIFDDSGSMGDAACQERGKRKIDIARRSALEFEQQIPAEANIGLYFLNHGEVAPLGSGAVHRKRIRDEIAKISAGGGTPLHRGIKTGYQKLMIQAQSQLGYGSYDLGIITDGEYTDSNPQQTVEYIVTHSPVRITTIGFCISEQHSLNQPGRVVYRQAGDSTSLQQGLKEILAEAPVFDLKEFK